MFNLTSYESDDVIVRNVCTRYTVLATMITTPAKRLRFRGLKVLRTGCRRFTDLWSYALIELHLWSYTPIICYSNHNV